MASDLGRLRVVLFGGLDAAGNALGDTWEWNGITWLRAFPSHSPSARWETAMACDLLRLRTVLFGGASPSGYLGDTWEWDGLDWSLRTVVAPNARRRHAMAYDLGRNRTV